MPDNLALSLPADLQTDNQLLSPASPAVPGNNRLLPQPDGGTDKQPLSRRLCTACGGGIPSRRHAYCSDRCARRVRREQREHSFHGKIAAVRRQLRAMARTAGRVQGQDRQEPGVVFEELALLRELEDEFRTDLQLATNGLRARGASWGEIGATFGISRQGARQRWGRPVGQSPSPACSTGAVPQQRRVHTPQTRGQPQDHLAVAARAGCGRP